jgi:PAS domain S-box-containing protein
MVISESARSSQPVDAAARLAAIFDSSFDAIVGKDLNSVITDWNRAAERLFGYTAQEAVGKSVLMLIPENRHMEEIDIIDRISRGERIETFETLRLRKDGTLIPVSLTISPIRNSDGEIVGASKIARDISQAKESERRIKLLMLDVYHRV